MTARQSSLFPKEPPKKRVWRMRVSDAGGCDGGGVLVTFQCSRCEYESSWYRFDTVTKAKRGLPCPRCN
jgi:hypothetical protein